MSNSNLFHKFSGNLLTVSVILVCFFTGLPNTRAGQIIGEAKATKLSKVKFPPASQIVYSGDGVPLGVAVRTAKGMTVALSDGREFLFDRFGTVVVAERAKSFVTFIPLGGEVATNWELSFYGSNGQQFVRYDQAHGFSKIAVAENGVVVVAGVIKIKQRTRGEIRQQIREEGGLIEENIGMVIYDEKGKEISRRLFPRKPLVATVAVNPSGEKIAIGLQQMVGKVKKRWYVQVQDLKSQLIQNINIPEPVQGLRFIQEENSLIILSAGGVRVVKLDNIESLPKLVPLPSGHYIPGPGRVFYMSGKLLVVTERASIRQKGTNVWYLFAADPERAEMKQVAEGARVRSRRSPGFSMSSELGAREWPVLVTIQSVMDLNF